MSDFERFKEDFLSKEKFYNSLTDKKKLVIKNMNMFLRYNVLKFEMKPMKYSYNLYLKWDVSLSADVFEKFRNNSSLINYGSCPSHYFSAPALIWDASMLNMTKVELERIPDTNIYLFFEKGMRVGFSYISKRYSKSNNKYINI